MSIRLRYLYRAYRYRYRVDPAELRYVCASLKKGGVAADIGCHKGAYTYWMRRRVGPNGAVYAFEPQPRQVNYLRQVFGAMSYDNVVVVPMAASNTTGRLPLHVPQGAGQSHAASLETAKREQAGSPVEGKNGEDSPVAAALTTMVDVTTLDTHFGREDRLPDLLKIDVEGHELAVLEGARRILEERRPAILVECEARHRPDGDVRPVFELLQSHGYDGSFFLKGHRYPLAAFQPSTHQLLPAANGPLPPHYVNNFAFVPRD